MGEDIKVGRVWTISIFISLGMFNMGFNLGVFNTCQSNVAESLNWGSNTNTFIAIASSCIPLGAAFSAPFGGQVCAKYGRRKTIILNSLLNIFGTGISMIPTTYTVLIGRVINGIVLGFYGTACPGLIAELVPEQIRGSVSCLSQLQVTIGILVAFTLGLALPIDPSSSDPLNFLWIGVFGFQIIPACILILALTTFFNVESPVWLKAMGQDQEALRCLRFVYTEQGINKLELQQPLDNTQIKSEQFDGSKVTFSQVFRKPYLRMTMQGILIMFIQIGTGANAVVFYSDVIYNNMVDPFMARIMTVVTGAVNMLSVFLAIPIIDKYGRRLLQLIGSIIVGIILAVLGFALAFLQDVPEVSIVCIMIYLIVFETTLGPICWTYCGETLIERSMSVAVLSNFIVMFVLVFTVPFISESIGLQYAFWAYSLVGFYGAWWAYKSMIETKGKTYDEIVRELTGLKGGVHELKPKQFESQVFVNYLFRIGIFLVSSGNFGDGMLMSLLEQKRDNTMLLIHTKRINQLAIEQHKKTCAQFIPIKWKYFKQFQQFAIIVVHVSTIQKCQKLIYKRILFQSLN